MKFKQLFLSAFLLAALSATAIASSPVFDDSPADTKAIKEIQSIVQNFDLDYEIVNNKTVKVHFMVNTSNEVVVLRTNDDDLDNVIKYGLNYKELKNKDLEVNKVYILPITFQATDS